ncbi:alpha/beta hydrolase [Pararhodonellum marinum]|uniref:alpha/beta hydrolase n=1 Tax=Pararhodonellum marinum TaxID=2755358 RepID=UPI00188FFA73|nr:alpha/beta hydrolase [Pararhodonellum marinum]
MKNLLILSLLSITSLTALAQNVMPLYKNAIPNAIDVPDEEKSETSENGILRISKVTNPTLTAYLPSEENATGQAVIICPGGGYWILAAGHEGSDVAEEFTRKGIAAFVLKYRLPNDESMIDKTIGPLQDAQRAIQMVRENADKWNINPDQIGILGFSAGGHLAATAGTQYQRVVIDNPNQTSLRPDFMVLVYAVVSFDPDISHSGSAKNLLGENPTKEMLDLYSNEKHVNENTPPTYLVHAKDDNVSIKNSYVMEAKLKEHHIPVGTTYFEEGGHGYGMNNPTSSVKWMDEVEKWMKSTIID